MRNGHDILKQVQDGIIILKDHTVALIIIIMTQSQKQKMTITATQVLELLTKATKLHIHYSVYEDDGEHFIQFEVDWYAGDYSTYSYEKVHISNQNESRWGVCWNFDTFMTQLDEKLEEERQEEIKAEKRKELIAKLTDEEMELLGFKK